MANKMHSNVSTFTTRPQKDRCAFILIKAAEVNALCDIVFIYGIRWKCIKIHYTNEQR